MWDRVGVADAMGGRWAEEELAGDEVPNKRRVEENKREGRRRVDEYYGNNQS